jgi:hypothetical protein
MKKKNLKHNSPTESTISILLCPTVEYNLIVRDHT